MCNLCPCVMKTWYCGYTYHGLEVENLCVKLWNSIKFTDQIVEADMWNGNWKITLKNIAARQHGRSKGRPRQTLKEGNQKILTGKGPKWKIWDIFPTFLHH